MPTFWNWTRFSQGLKMAALVLGLALVLAGCGKNEMGRVASSPEEEGDLIAAVKGGVLALDVGLTVGQAFDHYGGFVLKENKWTLFKTQNQRDIVQFTGIMDLNKANLSDAAIDRLDKVEFITQFGVNKNKTFEVRYMGYAIHPKGGPVKEYHIKRPQHDNFLKNIFGNYKFPNAVYELLIEKLVLT
ncbi:MAG: hypothetical protein JRJ59_08615 [Deltaproteobacteria bacterium]|nr:hypothetical protein [Deltaproteobacteria bacterium]